METKKLRLTIEYRIESVREDGWVEAGVLRFSDTAELDGLGLAEAGGIIEEFRELAAEIEAMKQRHQHSEPESASMTEPHPLAGSEWIDREDDVWIVREDGRLDDREHEFSRTWEQVTAAYGPLRLVLPAELTEVMHTLSCGIIP